jgi:hypothetical protein
LLPHLGELLPGVAKVSDHLRLRICLPALAAQQIQHPGMADSKSDQHLDGDVLSLAQRAQQEVLSGGVSL